MKMSPRRNFFSSAYGGCGDGETMKSLIEKKCESGKKTIGGEILLSRNKTCGSSLISNHRCLEKAEDVMGKLEKAPTTPHPRVDEA